MHADFIILVRFSASDGGMTNYDLRSVVINTYTSPDRDN